MSEPMAGGGQPAWPRPVAAAAVPHLVLVGLPGVGKSTVGARVAARLGRPFLDLDVELERRAGVSVAQLFAAEGEAGFRARERTLSAELAGGSGMVLAPGGGWVTDPAAVATLRRAGRIIYLRVSPEGALARLGPTRSTRPLLASADPLAAIGALLARRAALYEAADLTIDTEALSVAEVVDTVVGWDREWREAGT